MELNLYRFHRIKRLCFATESFYPAGVCQVLCREQSVTIERFTYVYEKARLELKVARLLKAEDPGGVYRITCDYPPAFSMLID